MRELDEFIDKATHLPPAPRILTQLLSQLNKPDSDIQEVVNLIAFDPSLTASVIRVCNSAFFAGGNPVETLDEAVGRLGFRQVYQMVAGIVGAKALAPKQKGYGINEGELWHHSATTAVAAQLMAQDQDEDASTVFTAALLHDIGKIVLSQALEHIYAKLVEDIQQTQSSWLETEKRLLGVQHAEIGGRLLARWNFPANLVAAVWFHHQPDAAQPHQRLAAYVYLGNMVAYFLGHGYGLQAFAMRGRAEALDILGYKPDDLPRYMIRTLEAMEEVERLLKIK